MFQGKAFGGARKPGGTAATLTIGGAQVKNYFSPEDHVAEKVVARLKAASTLIDFMAFSFTEEGIGSAVLDAAGRGVKVRGVFEKTGSETRFSEFGKMKNAGLDVWQDGNRYLMHHKVFVVDAKTVILGSFNFSSGADKDNDENLLMIDDPGLVRAFDAEFAKVYDQAAANQSR
jgi:phosphatidylserine/phosphatidylglycerophosphate/cardiolipin synthase-like enzyme